MTNPDTQAGLSEAFDFSKNQLQFLRRQNLEAKAYLQSHAATVDEFRERRFVAEMGILFAEIERLTAALGEREWRPIGNAPKDGTQILAYWSKSRLFDVVDFAGGVWQDNDTMTPEISSPTHWMPLPSPPKKETE